MRKFYQWLGVILFGGLQGLPETQPPIIDLYQTDQVLKEENEYLKTELLKKDHELKQLKQAFPGSFSQATTDLSKINSRAEANWKSAIKLLQSHRYTEAIRVFEKFIQKYPNTPHYSDAQYLLGKLSLLQGKIDQAIDYFSMFIKENPHDIRLPDAQFHLGLTYYAKKNHEMAYQLFQEVEEKYPRSLAARQARNQRQKLKLNNPN